MAEVDDVADAALYIGRHLNMRSCHVPKYIVSAHSVFPGWIGFSQWFRKEFGIYPPREMLIELGKMSKAEREKHIWFGLYLWEKNRNKS